MISTFFVSYLYELVGRKLTIFASFITTAALFVYLPYTAPDINKLIAARCAIGVTMSAPLANPLVPDYVKRSSRGRAVALNGIGFVIGEVFAMGVLFNLTKSMNYKDAFAITAGVIMVFSFFFLIAIKDPNMDNLRHGPRHLELAEQRLLKSQNSRADGGAGGPHFNVDGKFHSKSQVSRIQRAQKGEDGHVFSDNWVMLGNTSDYKDYVFEQLTTWQKIVELTLIVNNEMAHNPILLLLMLGAAITRLLSVLFSTYLLLWIQTFAKPQPEFNNG